GRGVGEPRVPRPRGPVDGCRGRHQAVRRHRVGAPHAEQYSRRCARGGAGSVLNHSELRALINFAEPVGLLMTAVLQFVADSSDPRGLVAQYVGALAPGSCLAVLHITGDSLPPRSVQTGMEVYRRATESAY